MIEVLTWCKRINHMVTSDGIFTDQCRITRKIVDLIPPLKLRETMNEYYITQGDYRQDLLLRVSLVL